jgi:hypothetical protein
MSGFVATGGRTRIRDGVTITSSWNKPSKEAAVRAAQFYADWCAANEENNIDGQKESRGA